MSVFKNLRLQFKKFGPTISSILLVYLLISANCFNRTRMENYNWQLDSLRYYTTKFDSVMIIQTKQISQLRVDLYTKTGELSEKIEMLNSRLGDTESQLTRISAKIGPRKGAPTDSADVSQINPEAQLIYDSAYRNYVQGNYPEAVSEFQSFLKLQPDSPLSDNAYYWIGESYDAMGKRQNAINIFQELINKFPGSSRIPTALYKMAVIYEEAGDKKTARFYYKQLIKDFPNSPEAALAKDKLE